MKKVLFIILVLLALSITLIYIVIPRTIEIKRTIYVNAVADVTYRHVSVGTGWERWLSSRTTRTTSAGNLEPGEDEIRYTVSDQTLGPIQVKISTRDRHFESTLLVVPLDKDSTALHWRCLVQTSNNPLTKIRLYAESRRIANSMDNVLDSVQSFLGKKDNLYNISIERAKVTDTILISTRITINHYPTTAEIYNEINKVKQYISSQGAKETNYPMLHILKSGSDRFETMVAIPVNKKIPDKGDIVYKRMVPGNILVTRVRGGRYAIEHAFSEMETYIKDHELVLPAIPFESLETDRIKEPDTAKWITRIYFPIL